LRLKTGQKPIPHELPGQASGFSRERASRLELFQVRVETGTLNHPAPSKKINELRDRSRHGHGGRPRGASRCWFELTRSGKPDNALPARFAASAKGALPREALTRGFIRMTPSWNGVLDLSRCPGHAEGVADRDGYYVSSRAFLACEVPFSRALFVAIRRPLTASSSRWAATCIGLTLRSDVLSASAISASLFAVSSLIGSLGRRTQLESVGRPGRSP
jgi:hypothetical protein